MGERRRGETDLRRVEGAIGLGGEVPDRNELRGLVLAQRDEVPRIGREIHNSHPIRVGHRDGLDRRGGIAVPQHDHRVRTPVRSGDPSAVLADARAADRVAVALQQLLRLAGEVVDDARVRGDVEDGAAVVVAQVVHGHVPAEAERPAQRQHVGVLWLRWHGVQRNGRVATGVAQSGKKSGEYPVHQHRGQHPCGRLRPSPHSGEGDGAARLRPKLTPLLARGGRRPAGVQAHRGGCGGEQEERGGEGEPRPARAQGRTGLAERAALVAEAESTALRQGVDSRLLASPTAASRPSSCPGASWQRGRAERRARRSAARGAPRPIEWQSTQEHQ